MGQTKLMVDTHCHLAGIEYIHDLREVVGRATYQGIVMISSSIERTEWDYNLEISRQFDSLFSTIGVNPEKWEDTPAATDWIRNHHGDITAIGEVGLDHYRTRDHSAREKQIDAFSEMIKLAGEIKLPLQVHSRSAGRVALKVLEKLDADAVHMHAFDGKAGLARNASNELGYYFSIPTSVVCSPQKQKLVKAVNIERLLLETDSPVLAAEKGTRNEPANLRIALNEVARILRRDEEELRKIILENTLKLYSRIRF